MTAPDQPGGEEVTTTHWSVVLDSELTSEGRDEAEPEVDLECRADQAVLELWAGGVLKGTLYVNRAGACTLTNAALLRELTADNFTLLAEEIAKRVATYQNGSPTTVIGPPTSGARVLHEFWRDPLGGEWRCTGAGTPGSWIQIRPAAVTADPSSGTIPTGYLIFNVTTGHIKRHAGGYAWEIP